MERFVCIHGHFDQPPRENPWLNAVELQDSAYPYHDWNDRVSAECYAPNAVARLLDERGRIAQLVNNYSQISFGFGPVLLGWLERHASDVYQAILEADRSAQEQFGGHGAALAQPYVHVPLPLLDRRDQITLLKWGVDDFERRFERRAEGIWLPESVASDATLELIAELDVRFVVLAPSQAQRARPLGDDRWRDVSGEKVDPTRAYLHRLPSGRAITLENLLQSGSAFAHRLRGGFAEERDWAQLVSAATTGEQFGHHVHHGDMALALALRELSNDPGIRVTVFGEYLDHFPPTHEVEIGDSRPSNQETETTQVLRHAMGLLRDECSRHYETNVGFLLKDPWTARDDFISVIHDRAAENADRFLTEHAVVELTEEQTVAVLQLLEMQRMTLLALTGTIWRANAVSSLETTQALRFADRALQLMHALFETDLQERFLQVLERIRDEERGMSGREVYEEQVLSQRIEWEQIGAHYAIRSLFESYPEEATLFCYQADAQSLITSVAGKARLIDGRVKLTSQLTRESVLLTFAFLHFGDHHVNGGVRPFQSEEDYQRLATEIRGAFGRADFAEVIRVLDRYFPASTYSLKSLFRDEQRKIIKQVIEPTLTEAESVLRRLHENNQPMMQFLTAMHVPFPQVLQSLADFLVRTDLGWELRDEELNLERIRELMDRAELLKMDLDVRGLTFRLKLSLARLAERFREQPDQRELLRTLIDAVRTVKKLPIRVDFWHPQNVHCQMIGDAFERQLSNFEEGDRDAEAWLEDFLCLGEELEVRVTELHERFSEAKDRPTAAELIDQVYAQRRFPRATYRFQFNQTFTFRDALEQVQYLSELGISDAYASPILQARPGSMHGYDICRHDRINPELGGEAGLSELVEVLHEHGMGLILDTVPNHVGIGHPSNEWWMDVLENGPSSIYAEHFDIDWNPVNPNLADKVLLPVLEDHYGKVLENGLIRLVYEKGAFHFEYHHHRWPASPDTYVMVLEPPRDQLSERLGDDDKHVQELESIVTALSYLPPSWERDPERITERNREKEIIKDRLDKLVDGSEDVRAAIDETVRDLNGTVAHPESFDRLEALLDRQAFRPAFWRVATDEINYRRFFDINDLAAIRVEDPEVFRETHELLLQLHAEGKANGLRIDHPDGLWDPTEYFRNLQEHFVVSRARQLLLPRRLPDPLAAEIGAEMERRWQEDPRDPTVRPLYVAAEKILCEGEELPRAWTIEGTTGYDFLNLANGLFVESGNKQAFQRIHSTFIDDNTPFHRLTNRTKKMIMHVSMASEINALSHRLDRISEGNRLYRDFTLNSLIFVIREILSCLSVYRTYVTGPENITMRDRGYVETAVEQAKQLNPRTAESIFDFVRDVLLLRLIDDFREEDRPHLIAWSMKFQQVTGPVMAKGVEDTALYVYNRMVSLNEVGGEPERFGTSVSELHAENLERRQRWPHSMLAGSTHDTKRSEDVRARLNVLSEMPDEWEAALQRWHKMNADKKTKVDGEPAPDCNDEYLLYQTLLGTWPIENSSDDDHVTYRERIQTYLQKATKEAKVHTSWVNTNEHYDNAVRDFVLAVLPDDWHDPFIEDLLTLQRRLNWHGYFNSLSQTVLRLTSPGVPDFYQGTELWDYSLVDPDNRRPVDYALRHQMLRDLNATVQRDGDNLIPLVTDLMDHLPDGRAKLYVTHRGLSHRRDHASLYVDGDYKPLEVIGEKNDHACAYLRRQDDEAILVVVPRLVATLVDHKMIAPIGAGVWQGTRVVLPEEEQPRAWVNLFTNERLTPSEENEQTTLPLADVLAHFPVAILVQVSLGSER